MNETPPIEDELLPDEAEVDAGDELQPEDEPSELDVLRSKVAELEKNSVAIEDLKRTVGRIQSLTAKFESAPAAQRAEIQQQIDDRFSTVSDQIETLLSGLDETAIDPATRQKILAAREATRRAAEVQKLVDDEITKRTPKPAPTQTTSPVEEQIVALIEAADLDPDAPIFDWKGEMTQLVLKDPSGKSLRSYVLNKIVEAKAEEESASRRTTAKRQAGSGTPRPASPANLDADRERLRTSGLPMTESAKRKQIAENLGLTLEV